jgi:SAM-dependent methyltransferase/acyl carrier protein
LIAYFVPDPNQLQAQIQRTGLQESHVAQWRLLYEQTYGQSTSVETAGFNITGWNSSYTGLPIPADEMREWRDATVARILALHPRRVLEIGCGTGLLLFPIAPQSHEYWATDFSRASLDLVRRQLEVEGDRLAHVRLFETMADDFRNIDPGSFNLVILNSVIQYFPNVEYLLRVLEGAIKAVEPGGHVFLGDVRNLRLLEALHTSVQLAQADPDLSVTELRQRVQRSVNKEEELLIDGRFFNRLKDRIPAISHVEVKLKRGRHHNELTGFRYDVILSIRGEALNQTECQQPSAAECRQLDWAEHALTLPDLTSLLRTDQPPGLYIKNVPDARVMTNVRAVELLTDEATATAGQLLTGLSEHVTSGVDPEDVWRLCSAEGYTADLRLSASGEAGCFYIFLARDSNFPAEDPPARASTDVPPTSHAPDARAAGSLGLYVNNPLRKATLDQLLPELRDYLAEKLPDYMLPGVFVALDSMPVMPNGKIDRRALPNPDRSNLTKAANFVPARTPNEELLARVWAEMLGLDRVSVQDNFFELGGHSLMVAQMVSRLRDIFSLELPVRTIFEKPTVAELAEHIETIQWGTQSPHHAEFAAGDIEEGEV